MNDIITLPASVQARLQEARTLASQNRFEDADHLVRETGRALATAQPELCATLLASTQGYCGVLATTTELTTKTVEKNIVVLGTTVGRDVQVTREAKTTTKRVEFF